MSPSSTLNYPRTGKRGVPQQFPRRLYEMLECEAKVAGRRPDDVFVISWSDSGTAFCITDAEEFASTILPKYFRTKKFSSFQRNLNLYGFTKVRRGPDTDMYAHNSFIRNEPSLLSQLRKSTSASRQRSRVLSDDSDTSSIHSPRNSFPRSVSPCSPHNGGTYFQPIAQRYSSPQSVTQTWLPYQYTLPVLIPMPTSPKAGAGRLDLLALAIEQEICSSA